MGYIDLRVMMLLCSLAYVAMVLSNVIKISDEPDPIWAFPITMNVLVGINAPLLWTGQNVYLCRCATQAASVKAAASTEGLDHWTQQMTTRYNSLFFSIYQSCGMSGNIVASVILLA